MADDDWGFSLDDNNDDGNRSEEERRERDTPFKAQQKHVDGLAGKVSGVSKRASLSVPKKD